MDLVRSLKAPVKKMQEEHIAYILKETIKVSRQLPIYFPWWWSTNNAVFLKAPNYYFSLINNNKSH